MDQVTSLQVVQLLDPHLAAHAALSSTLPDHTLLIPTFFFEYPSLEEILSHLDKESTLTFGTSWMDEVLQQALKSSGLEFLDNFTMISPRMVYLINRIPVEMIRELYARAEMMLLALHLEREAEIVEIEEMRREYRACHQASVDII